MIDKVNKPEDWGIADKEEWVADQALSGEAMMPALEGRDVVGFSESVDFAAGQFIPDNVKQMAAGQPNYTFTNPQTGQTYIKRNGHWTVSGQNGKEVQKRMSRAIDRGNVPKERVDEPKTQSKTVSKPPPKREEKPLPRPQPPKVKKPAEVKQTQQIPAPAPSPASGKNRDGSISNGDIDIATSESLGRVKELASTPSTDSRFEAGRNNQDRFKNQFSQNSPYRAGLDNLNRVAKDKTKVGKLLDLASSGSFDETVSLTAKESLSVRDLLTGAGIDVNNKAEVDSFVNTYKIVNGFIRPDGNWKTGETHELTGSNLGYFEAQHISERSDLLSESPSGIQVKAFNFSSENKSDLANLDPKVTEAVFHLLPTNARVQLSKSGSPKTFYDPTAENQQGRNANSIRGAAVLHMWTMQDGISAYSAAGQRRSPGEYQVEHIVPLKSGGSDHIDNFALITRRENEPRADLSFDKFLDQAKRKAENVNADLNDPKVRAEFEDRYRAAFFNEELAPIMSGSVGGLIDDSIVSNVNSGLVSGLGEEGAKNLKFSLETWSRHKSQVADFLKENGVSPDTTVENLSADQLSGVFDLMKENLGVEKEKMVEYMGRALFNNYDLGVRHVINKKTNTIEEGRSGTAPSPGSLLNMQNLLLTEKDGVSPEQTKAIIERVKNLHQNLKKSRTEFIRNPGSPEAYENYTDSIVDTIKYLTGVGDDSPLDHRVYDTRFTASSKNNIHSDTANAIMSLLSLDTASVKAGKDVLSPGSQKNLTEKSRQNIVTLSNFLISSFVKTSGLTPEQIKNPDTLTKTKRKPIEPLIAALENANRGLNS